MAEYKVLQNFRDKNTKELYSEGAEIDMTVKRAKEVEKKLGEGFLERLDTPQKEDDSDAT
jgi:hypothetical protein